MSTLRVIPLTFKQVCAFVTTHHRHHKAPRGGKIFLGVRDQTGILGVAVIGRPNARAFDKSALLAIDTELTAEVTRTCTLGAPNANSKLYGACRQIAKSLGYDRLITYTETGESGVSLRAAGFVCVKTLAPRKNWANSSQQLKGLRDATVREGVERYLWEVRFTRDRTDRAPLALESVAS